MALDPRFAPLIAALSGRASDMLASGQAASLPATAAGAASTAPQTEAALSNPNTAAALSGASAPSPAAQRAGNVTGLVLGAESGTSGQPQQQQAQPGYGSTQAAQPSQLGGQQTPATMSPEAAAQGAASAQTASEMGLWDTILQNLAGRDPSGNMLTGQALKDFQTGHALGGFLGALGAGIGGDSTGGRLGQAVYNQAAGGLAANNAERREANQNDFMQAALASISARNPAAAGAEGPISQPSRQQYTPATTSTPTGGLPSQQEASAMPSGSVMASLDDSLARMRRLTGIA